MTVPKYCVVFLSLCHHWSALRFRSIQLPVALTSEFVTRQEFTIGHNFFVWCLCCAMPGDPSTKGKIVLLLSGVFTFIFRSIVKQSSRSEILCQSVKVCSRFNARLFLVVVNMAFAFLSITLFHSLVF